MKPLRIGVVGCGYHSENHLRVYSHTSDVRIVAVCDKVLSKAREKSRRYGADFAFENYSSILDLDLDLVDIITPTRTHGVLSRQALETGHNVLVEKPMALTSAECQSMIRAARRSGRTLCISHNQLFYHCVTQARTAVDDGSIRPSTLMVASMQNHVAFRRLQKRWRSRERSEGLLWDTMAHPIYLTQHLLGPIKSVFATARKVKGRVFDSFSLVMQGHGVGYADYVWDAKRPVFELRLVGEDGEYLEADLVHDVFTKNAMNSMTRRSYVLKSVSEDLSVYLTKWKRYLGNLYEIQSYPGALPYQRTFFILIRRYISYLRGECDSPPVSAEDGLQSVNVLEATKRSIDSARPERV